MKICTIKIDAHSALVIPRRNLESAKEILSKPASGKAGKRRLYKKTDEFREIWKYNRPLFHRRWKRKVSGWITEIHFRARQWNEEIERDAQKGKAKPEIFKRLGVFDFLETIEKFIHACGVEIESEIGAETRRVLLSECVKAVSAAFEAKFGASLTQAWLYRRIKK